MSSPTIGVVQRAPARPPAQQFEQGLGRVRRARVDDVAAEVLALAERSRPVGGCASRGYGWRDPHSRRSARRQPRLRRREPDPHRLGPCGVRHTRRGVRLVPRALRPPDRRPHDEIESDHREAQGESFTPAEHELGMLSGLVQYGWRIAHSARIHLRPLLRRRRRWATGRAAVMGLIDEVRDAPLGLWARCGLFLLLLTPVWQSIIVLALVTSFVLESVTDDATFWR